jgi:hypothetical protein
MIRGAGLTLGGLLLLGGASAVHADDPSASEAPSAMSIAPAMYGVFSGVPENWSDLPVQLKFSQSVGYNSNVLGGPTNGAALGLGSPIGSLYSISTIGASTKAYWEGQQFFADGSIGMYRYLADGELNTLAHSLDLGDNWTYGSKCSGKLELSEQTSPALPTLTVGANEFNVVTTTALNETGKCLVSGEYALVLNSGVTSSTNSAAVDKSLDYRSEFIAAGISYSVPETNSLQLLATVTGTDYTAGQAALSSLGLLSNITEDELNLTYTKNFSPNLALTASYGVVGVRNSSFTLNPASGWEPVYSLSTTWTATPKLGLTASASKTVALPTSILANLQVSESANLGLTYSLTPKVLLAAGVSASYLSGFTTAVPSGTSISPTSSMFTAPAHSYSASVSINYAMTPFVTANLSYTDSKSVQANLVTPTSIILLALTFNPY